MNVEELFHCFAAYFDKIIFYDVTENVQDTVQIKILENYDKDAYWSFAQEYGEYTVTEWQYVKDGNYIDITIER